MVLRVLITLAEVEAVLVHRVQAERQMVATAVLVL
jgi:hypothetical protein